MLKEKDMMKKVFLVSVILLFSFVLFGQKTKIYSGSHITFHEAVELYNSKQYNAAATMFRKIIAVEPEAYSGLKAESRYYVAMCAIQLLNKDADYQIYRFVNHFPDHPKVNDATFQLGKYFYTRKKYRDAIEWFEKTDPFKLNKEDRAEYYFKTGYSYFLKNDLDTARVFLYEIKDADTKYTSPAIYYYSHINYSQNNYQTALEGFLRLQEDDTFGPIVPYYISQVYYLQEKYHEVVEYAPPLLESVTEKRKPEMTKIIGDAYFNLDDFEHCVPYLEEYMQQSGGATRKAKYQLGFACYMNKDFSKAIELFEQLTNKDDKLSQNALYHLGDCYIKTDEKNKALFAYSSASSINYDKEIHKNALFNYGVLSYEIEYSPFNEAVNAFNKYIELYPYSPKIQTVYNYLVKVYLSTSNYQKALDFLDKIEYKDSEIKQAYQRAAFYRGLELYKDQDFNGAQELFDKSLHYQQFDRTIAARANYWKGETLYREKKYEKAINHYDIFMVFPGNTQTPEYEICHYNLGYARFNLKEYTKALRWFNKYLELNPSNSFQYLADACNRVADAYYIGKNYSKAIDYYNKNIKMNKFGVDYAIFQKGFCLGLLKKHSEKIATLENLLEKFPNSAFNDDAVYETGRSHEMLNINAKAIVNYQDIINNYPNSSYVKKSLLQLALIYYNQDKLQKALASYKQVVKKYPATKEAKSALNGMEKIYVEMGDIDKYWKEIANLGISVEKTREDSLTYYAAESVYMTGDCEKAVSKLQHYLDKFKRGRFLLQAHFYRADCYYRGGEFDKAIKSFDYIINQPVNIYTEQSLIGASYIYFQQEKWDKALEYYTKMEEIAEIKANKRESVIGQMRCAFRLEQYETAISSAKKLTNSELRSKEMQREAHFVLAQSNYKMGKTDEAYNYFEKVAKDVKSVEGAESRYRMIEILFDKGEKSHAKDMVFKFVNEKSPHQFWLAKSFMILVEILLEEGDEFQAIHTLQSIIDNYDHQDDNILKAANKKLKSIRENSSEEAPEQDELEIEMKSNEENEN
jgi:TolA-binding protein